MTDLEDDDDDFDDEEEYEARTPPSWATDLARDLSLARVEEFGDWQRQAGIPELQVMLLFGWDPDNHRPAFPESLESYGDVAHSVILGLYMGDTRAASMTRLRRASHRQDSVDHEQFFGDAPLANLLDEIEAWLPRSLSRWWRRRVGSNLRALPFHCHLIKYNPQRSIAGYFDDGTWTSYSDIGTKFDGVVLTAEAYERIEQAHLDAIEVMARESGATSFVVDLQHDEEPTLDLPAMVEQVRCALRDTGDGWLWRTPDSSMYVVVGHDYHVDVGSSIDCTAGFQLAVDRGLHPRRAGGPSPYLYIE